MATFLARVGDLFQQAIDRGELTADTDVAQTLMAFFSFYMTCLIGGVRGDVFQVDVWAEMFGRLLDDFILTGSQDGTTR